MYETKISDKRWMAYDLPGNVGWIMYLAGLILTFTRKPEFISYWGMFAVMVLAIIPAVMMVIGIAELINERIHKLDRVLTKARFYRGFGMLYWGGIAGAAVALIGAVYGLLVVKDCGFTYVWVMLIGGVLCAVFAGLLFKGYRLSKDLEAMKK